MPTIRFDWSSLLSFHDLNVDEQIDLVTLAWLGRGDGDLDSWDELRVQAASEHNNRTASYLLGTPLLADYLEDALSQLGKPRRPRRRPALKRDRRCKRGRRPRRFSFVDNSLVNRCSS